MGPWTRAVSLQWPTQFAFFDLRSTILREAEERGLLQEFRWGAADLGLRIGKYEALRCRASGIDIWGLSPDVDDTDLHRRADMVIDLLSPNDISVSSASFIFLLPVAGEYEAARRQFSEQLAGEVLPEASPVDSAMLLDGRADGVGCRFQVEYGVVSADEIPARLSGLGRVQMLDPESIEPDRRNVPSCALFLSWSWTADQSEEQRRLVDRSVAEPYWATLMGEAESLSTRILVRHGLGYLDRAEEEA